jgi:uncharacterized membrane-anchored protein YitT (DUF2179 family)
MNLPFYALAVRQLGWRFTIKSLIAVSLMSALADADSRLLHARRPAALAVGAVLFGVLAGGSGDSVPARRDAGRGGDRGPVAAGRNGLPAGARS